MPVFLFHDVIFGPVRSRRLGLSLGINLLPVHSKYCSFNCIYCECGWTENIPGDTLNLPSRIQVREFLEQKLKSLVAEDYIPDALTFAGNGEPTIHPDFPEIVDDIIDLRNNYVPHAKVAILSNASMIHNERIFNALRKLDLNIQKLDCGSEKLFRLINNPVHPERFREMIGNLRKFNGQVIIQSLFLKGFFNGLPVDNTTDEELSEWLKHIEFINPEMVMIYSLDRATPSHQLEKVSLSELEKIAEKVKILDIKTTVY
jgi:wyosine [tRNA(Phe)-imidazoG37] synthetase (radical SAM superfamily)